MGALILSGSYFWSDVEKEIKNFHDCLKENLQENLYDWFIVVITALVMRNLNKSSVRHSLCNNFSLFQMQDCQWIVMTLNIIIGLNGPYQSHLGASTPTLLLMSPGPLTPLHLGVPVLACIPLDLTSWPDFCLVPSPCTCLVTTGLWPSVGWVMICGLTFQHNCQPASAAEPACYFPQLVPALLPAIPHCTLPGMFLHAQPVLWTGWISLHEVFAVDREWLPHL